MHPSDVSSLCHVGPLALQDVFACLGRDKASRKELKSNQCCFLPFLCFLLPATQYSFREICKPSSASELRLRLLEAEPKCSAGAHLPAGSVTPFQCCICRKLLLPLCLTGQVNTMLGLIQQLWAVKGSDPPPSPALEQGLSTLLREHASFFMSFFFFGQVIFWLWFPSQFTAEAHTSKQEWQEGEAITCCRRQQAGTLVII